MATMSDSNGAAETRSRPTALELSTSRKMREHMGLWGDAWRRLKRNRAAVLSLVFLIALIFSAIAAPLLTAYDPYSPEFGETLQPPSAKHVLGTDELGRDMLTRLLYGARVSLAVGLIVQTVALAFGTLMGLTAGYFGGTTDTIIMRIVDIMYAFPNFLFAVFMVSLLSPSITSIILVLSIVGWPFDARLIRGQVLSLREWEFVDAARVVGATNWRIMTRHILTNTLSPLIVAFTIGIAGVIISEAGLSFLGIGIRPPNPTWGGMIAKGRQYFRTFPFLALYPSIALGLTVLAFNFLGDGLRDALDPRLRR
jgi:peptide/nickel transport system permease protein